MRNKILAFPLALAALFAGACGQNVTAIKFGVVTDVHHYAGQPAGTRYYQASLGKLREALATFEKEEVQFVVNLGDTVDRDLRSYTAVVPLFEAASMPVYHVVGNHDFGVEAGQEEQVLPALGLKDSYYAFSRGDWVFVVLNGFELRFPFPGDEAFKQESEALYAGLRAGGKNNARPWNGGIGRVQLGFLEGKLKQAQKSGKNALVFCHFPVLPESASNLWNDAEAVALLEKYPSVKAYFCGHNHAGGYVFKNGIHYLTFQAMVETPDSPAYAVVTIEKDAILIKGFGREPSRELGLEPGR